MNPMKPADHMIQLQGRDYLPVAARVVWARREHPAWSIVTEPTAIGDAVYMRATVMDDDGRVLATAHKAVRRDGRGAVGQYPVEAAETGAIGRALGLCGYGTLAGDLGEDDEIADAPVTRPTAAPAPTTNGRPARATEKLQPAPAAFHATPLIEAMASVADLADVCRQIQAGYTDNPHARSAAWAKAIAHAADNLCQSVADVDVVAAALSKAHGKMTATDRGAAGLAVDTARRVLTEVAAQGVPA